MALNILYMDWKASTTNLTAAFLNTIGRSTKKKEVPSDIIYVCDNFVTSSFQILNNSYYFGYSMDNQTEYRWYISKSRWKDSDELFSRKSFLEKIICDKALSGIGLTDNEHIVCKQIGDLIRNMRLLGLPSWTNEDKIFSWTPIIIKKDELCIDHKDFNFIDLDINQKTQLKFLKILDKWNDIKSIIEEKFSFKFDDYFNMDLTLANKDGYKFKVEYNPLTLENILKIKSLRYDGFIYFEDDEQEFDAEDKSQRGTIIKELKEMITKNKDNKYDINDEKIVIDKIKQGWSGVDTST